MLSNTRFELIKLIANDEPVLMNFYINMDNVKEGKYAVYTPRKNTTMTPEEIASKAVLTPAKYQSKKSRKNKMEETHEKQMKDSDVIFTAISTGNFDNFKQAQQMVVFAYIPDMSFSRAGISHALKRLERFYS